MAIGMNGAAVLTALAALLAGDAARAADAPHWPPAGVSYHGDPGAPDISGLWLGTMTGVPGEQFAPNRGPADGRPPTFFAPWPLPYTPRYQKIYEERLAAAKKGTQLGDTSARCLPFGMPRVLISKVYPDEIVQTPGEVTLLVFGTFPVVIWTDGRPHPANLTPSYNGHSIGRWIGDTLFVDTVGIEAGTALDTARDPHGPALHLKWSIQRVADDILHVHVTLYDPDAFSEPVTAVAIWQRKTDPKWQVLDDQSCFENNNSDKVPEGGFIKF